MLDNLHESRIYFGYQTILKAKLMADDIQQEDYVNQIRELVRDFLLIGDFIDKELPKELAHLKTGTDELPFEGQPQRPASYRLFHRVSSILYGKDNLKMSELSHALSVPLSTATGMVDWLVDNGYAQRLLDPEDRRVVRVALTESGEKLHKIIESHITQRLQQILFYLTVDERNSLFAAFRKVASALKR